MTKVWWRLAATVAGMAYLLAANPAPAGAGGGEWMYPVRDRYEPGQDVLMVGYTLTAEAGGAGRSYAWLRVDPAADARGAVEDGPYVDPSDVRVAPIVVEATPVDEVVYGRRASISFTLPDDLVPGRYSLVLCDDPCTRAPGFLISEVLNVGVQPEYPIVRNWPASEPAIRWLDDDALLNAPDGQQVTAADYRAGRFPPATVAPAPPAPAVTAPIPPAPATTAARVAAPEPEASTSAEPTAGRGGADWATLGGWLAGLAALALASALLMARARSGRRTEPARVWDGGVADAESDGSEPAGVPDDEATLVRR